MQLQLHNTQLQLHNTQYTNENIYIVSLSCEKLI